MEGLCAIFLTALGLVLVLLLLIAIVNYKLSLLAARCIKGSIDDYRFISTAKRDIKQIDKAILVTGAASGLGYCLVKRLLDLGCYIYAADINVDSLKSEFNSSTDETKRNPMVSILKLDITNQADLDGAFEDILNNGRGLFAIINSAAIIAGPGIILKDNGTLWTDVRGTTELSIDAQIRPVFEVNVLGTMRVINTFVSMIIESKGCIINVSSAAGRFTLPAFATIYSASKFALNGYTNGLRTELKEKSVRVVSVEPGFIKTPMSDPFRVVKFENTIFKSTWDRILNRTELGKLMRKGKHITPEKVAEVIIKCLFNSKVPSHVLVDHPLMVFKWSVLSLLPQYFLDKLMYYNSYH